MLNPNKLLWLLTLVLGIAAGHMATASQVGGNVQVDIITEGQGEAAVRHSKVKVHYTGWLKDGTKFDSSRDRGTPFEFTIGAGQVIRGWDIGIAGMKIGEKRELVIPPRFGYGSRGAGRVIPPGAVLKFEVELVSLTPPKYTNIDNAGTQQLLKRGVTIIDIRRPDEWADTGVIKGSQLLTAFDRNGRIVAGFPQKFQEAVKQNDEVILICRSGNRSSTLAQLLTDRAGYTKVYNVTRGITDWISNGHSVEK